MITTILTEINPLQLLIKDKQMHHTTYMCTY